MKYGFTDIIGGNNNITMDKNVLDILGNNNARVLCRIAHWVSTNKENQLLGNSNVDINKDGKWWMFISLSSMAKDCRLSERVLKDTVKFLEDAKLLYSTVQYNVSNFYRKKWYTVNEPAIIELFKLWGEYDHPDFANGGGQSETYKSFWNDWMENFASKYPYYDDISSETPENTDSAVVAQSKVQSSHERGAVVALSDSAVVAQPIISKKEIRNKKYDRQNADSGISPLSVPPRPRTEGGISALEIERQKEARLEEEQPLLIKYLSSQWVGVSANMRKFLERVNTDNDAEGKIIELPSPIQRYEDETDYRLYVAERVEYYTKLASDKKEGRGRFSGQLAKILLNVKKEYYGYYDWLARQRQSGSSNVSQPEEIIVSSEDIYGEITE